MLCTDRNRKRKRVYQGPGFFVLDRQLLGIMKREDVLWISWRERKDRRKGAVEIIPECWDR